MLRQPRRAALLTAVFLLTSASAEGAWVLWYDRLLVPSIAGVAPRRSYVSVHGIRSDAECQELWEHAMKTEAGQRIIDPSTDPRLTDADVRALRASGAKLIESTSVFCLPDTVDPRGSKEK